MGQNEVDQYLGLFCPAGVPDFLLAYAQAPEMQRLKGVGLFCGTDYAKVYHQRYFYSRYHHSLGVAMIVWHFTRDRKQAIAGLLHDIATPVFSHSVDFMNGDALTQTSTEDKTRDIIAGSDPIMAQLRRDGLALSQVADYHCYPVADNPSPRLSADRLEYSFSTQLVWLGGWGLGYIGELFQDLVCLNNADGEIEIGFSSLARAEAFALGACQMGLVFLSNANKLSLSLLGDILKMGIDSGVFEPAELYRLTEAQAIERLKAAPDPRLRRAWDNYTRLTVVHGTDQPPAGCYAASIVAKRRYIDPLVCHQGIARRVSQVSDRAKAAVSALLAFEDQAYGYVDFTL